MMMLLLPRRLIRASCLRIVYDADSRRKHSKLHACAQADSDRARWT